MKIKFKAITDLFSGQKTELPEPKEEEEKPIQKSRYNLKELSKRLRTENFEELKKEFENK